MSACARLARGAREVYTATTNTNTTHHHAATTEAGRLARGQGVPAGLSARFLGHFCDGREASTDDGEPTCRRVVLQLFILTLDTVCGKVRKA